MHTPVHTRSRTQCTSPYTHMHTHEQASHPLAHIYTHQNIDSCTHTHTHITRRHTHICTHHNAHSCNMCTHTYNCAHTQCTLLYIHIHLHTHTLVHSHTHIAYTHMHKPHKTPRACTHLYAHITPHTLRLICYTQTHIHTSHMYAHTQAHTESLIVLVVCCVCGVYSTRSSHAGMVPSLGLEGGRRGQVPIGAGGSHVGCGPGSQKPHRDSEPGRTWSHVTAVFMSWEVR